MLELCGSSVNQRRVVLSFSATHVGICSKSTDAGDVCVEVGSLNSEDVDKMLRSTSECVRQQLNAKRAHSLASCRFALLSKPMDTALASGCACRQSTEPRSAHRSEGRSTLALTCTERLPGRKARRCGNTEQERDLLSLITRTLRGKHVLVFIDRT